MSGPSSTALQEAQRAVRDLLLDARETLSERSYLAFVDFVCSLIAAEAARCRNWARDHEGEAGR